MMRASERCTSFLAGGANVISIGGKAEVVFEEESATNLDLDCNLLSSTLLDSPRLCSYML